MEFHVSVPLSRADVPPARLDDKSRMCCSEYRLTPVEQAALASSSWEAIYPPTEKIPVVSVRHFYGLGRLTALRFLEWAQEHPDGVIALPTGKTPEPFIHWTIRLLDTWQTPETQQLLAAGGIDPARKPEVAGLRFVQIDEFYPINPTQTNSFFHYVENYYLKGFGLDGDKALLMDCRRIGLAKGQTLESVWPDWRVGLSLRTRHAGGALERTQQQVLHRVDQWCQEYEDRIRAMGGIGFFLGGIGPDGHIGFNVRGSDHHSTTRLLATNYETQANSAADLGGIEVARSRLVVTIGLGTIGYNPDCTAIVMAAGEAKGPIVADAVEGPESVLIPASALRRLPNARFYLTQGAACRLQARRVLAVTRRPSASDRQAEAALVDLAVARNKRLVDLTADEVRSDPVASAVLAKRSETLPELADKVGCSLADKLEAGCRKLSNACFLHTEPHHDDLMLGCLPQIVRNIRDASNVHHFVTLTSGFTSVTNAYMLRRIERLRDFLATPQCAALHADDYFEPGNELARDQDVWKCLDGIAARNEAVCDEGASRRLLRNLIAVYEERDLRSLGHRLEELAHYCRTVYPGKKDIDAIQDLKGMCREWEAECLWGYFGWRSSHVHHLRLGFYTGDIFTPAPTIERDVIPVLALLRRLRPDVLTVALDPEGSGPDTHYKVLQILNEAVQRHAEADRRRDIRIWGYRNIWYRFHPSEANIFVPVSLNMFSVMESAFANTFLSQREASFPSFEYDGPFSHLAQRIQVEQYQRLQTCLGNEWFDQHPSALMRATRGLVFLREMNLDQFAQTAQRLREATETV
jgi:glucosamine-6-phosphate deaminase